MFKLMQVILTIMAILVMIPLLVRVIVVMVPTAITIMTRNMIMGMATLMRFIMMATLV